VSFAQGSGASAEKDTGEVSDIIAQIQASPADETGPPVAKIDATESSKVFSSVDFVQTFLSSEQDVQK
jgi:hypothetical protein